MEKVTTIAQMKGKIRYGDYIVLSELLGVSQQTAKTRVFRGNQQAIEAMQAIISNREEFIKSYQSKINKL